MKKLGFEQQGNSIYLVYELVPEDNVDSMSLGMLMNNRIPGFAPVTLTQIDDKKRIRYDVTARVPASQYLLGTVNKKRILGVFGGIVRAILSAEDYMIDDKTIQLDLGSIFSDVATGDTVLLCLPVVVSEVESTPDLRAFFKNILFNAQYDELENRDYVAKLMNYLNGTPTFSLPEFKRILDYLMVESVPKESQTHSVSAAVGATDWPAAVQIVSPAVPMNAGQPQQAPVQQRLTQMQSGPALAEEPQGKSADQISLFYLLQHYNKDNAAAYKAQKEAKKAEKKSKKKAKSTPPKQQGTAGFSIPGQEEIPSVPVDGQCVAQGDQHPVPQQVQRLAQVQPYRSAPQVNSVSEAQPQLPVAQTASICSAPPAVQSLGQFHSQQPSLSQPVSAVIEETLFFSEKDGDETVLLGCETLAQKLIPHLVRKRNNERIPVNKEVFRLGRDVEYNDYAVTDNRYIGHGHCHIVIRGGEYFVVDDNSKNQTKVNGEVITPGVEVKIAHGYTICLADEDFEFRLY